MPPAAEGSGPVGVLLMAYGTPATTDDLEAYYTHVRRGRAPAPEQLADLRRRYDAIGGTSPLMERTRAQAACLQAALDTQGSFLVTLGMKHAPPFIEDAVETLVGTGIERAVGVVLAPHFSELSVGEYMQRADAAADGRLLLRFVRQWHDSPLYLYALGVRVRVALAHLPAGSEVVFTAHSLPARILETGDPYPEQLRATAAAVADRAGAQRWRVAWQSAGRTPEPWLGPDVLNVLDELAAAGVPGVLVCPAGFVSDHLEILYDLDIEARAHAEELGLAFARTPSLNDDPKLCAALAGAVLDALGN